MDEMNTVSGVQKIDHPAGPRARWRRIALAATPAAGGAGLFVASTTQTSLVVTVVTTATATTALAIGGLITNPRRLTAWIYELAEVPVAITYLIEALRAERPKWKRRSAPDPAGDEMAKIGGVNHLPHPASPGGPVVADDIDPTSNRPARRAARSPATSS